jgi:hypothetical protein
MRPIDFENALGGFQRAIGGLDMQRLMDNSDFSP